MSATTLLFGLLLIISAATNILRAQQQQQEQEREFDWSLAPTEACQQIRIVRRQEWGSKRSLERLDSYESSSSSSVGADGGNGRTTPYRVFIHQAWDGRSCADIDSCSIRLQAIQAYHQHSKGWPDISYNFLISADGTVYEGLGFKKIGFHTLDYNHNSLGIAFIGTFQDIYPTQQMERSLRTLLDCAVESNYLARGYMLHGHRDARCTICPGNAAYERISRMQNFRPGPLARYSCPTIVSELASQNTGGGLLPTAMAMQNNQQGQRVHPSPSSVQVLNINSNNQMISAAVAKDADGQRLAQPNYQEDTIVGIIQRKQTPLQPRESHSKKTLFKDEPRDDGDDRAKALISKGPKESLILVNVQQPDQHQQQQPQLYILTTKTVPKTAPILLISPPSHSRGGGGGSSRDQSPPRGEGGESEEDGGRREGGSGGENERGGGENGPGGDNDRGGGSGSSRRSTSRGGSSGGSSGEGGSRGGSGGGSNRRGNSGENSDGDSNRSGGGMESALLLGESRTKPTSLLEKLFDLDVISNITSKFFL